MEQGEFEKRFLAIVNQTDIVITAPNVAYNLNISIEEAQEHLLSLELNGTLQQQSDSQGNTIYIMPNRPAPGTLPAQIGGGEQPGGPPPGVHNPAQQQPAPIYHGAASAPISSKSINEMVLNFVFPGLGSMINGRSLGFAMLALFLLGIVLLFAVSGWSRLIGFLPIAIAWLWSIVYGLSSYFSNKGGG